MSYNRDTDSAVELHRIITSALVRRYTLPEILASAMADDLTTELRTQAGGAQLYVPQRSIQQRNAEILAAFDGTNTEALARRHHLSRRQVERIVRAGCMAGRASSGTNRASA